MFYQVVIGIIMVALLSAGVLTLSNVNLFQAETQNANTLRAQFRTVATLIAQSMVDFDGDVFVEVPRVNFSAQYPTPLTTTVNAGEPALPTSGYYIASSYNSADRSDVYGSPFAICIVDNGTSTGGTGYIAGSNSSANTAFSILSAGPDKVFQTSCATAVNVTPTASGDDFVVPVSQSGAETLITQWVNRGSGIIDVAGSSTKVGIGTTPTGASAQLTVAQNASIGTDLSVTGNLSVAGTSTLGAITGGAGNFSSLSVTGNASITGTTTAAAINASSLSTTGNITVGGTLGATGNTSLSTVSTSGAATLNSAAITNNATVGGTLGVTGAATFSNNVTIPNGTSSAPSLRFSSYASNGLYAGNDTLRGGLNGNFTGIASVGGPGLEVYASAAHIVGLAPTSVSSGIANILLIRGGETNGSGIVGGSINIGTGINTVDGDSGGLNLFTRSPVGTNRWSGAVQLRSNAANTGSGGGTGSIHVYSGNANAGSSGWVYVYTGNTTGANRSGRVNISSGENTGSAGSGDINIEVGRTYGTGQGGTLYLSGGRTMSGATAGSVSIIGGASESTGQTGYVEIRGGNTNSTTSPHILVYGASQGYMSFNGLSFFGHTSGPASLFFNPTYGGEGIFGPNGTNVGYLGDSSYIWGRSHIRDGYFYNILRVNGNDVWHNGNFPANPLTGVAVGRVLAWDGTRYVPTAITAAGGGGGVTITEDDPQVGTVTNGSWCVGAASGIINCTTASPVITGTNNTIARFNGSGALISSTNMTFDGDGEVNFATGLETPYVTYTSDGRLKNWEKELDNPLSYVRGIRTGFYTPNDTGVARGMPNRRTFGVIAQDIYRVLPEAVRTNSDGYMAVDYPMLGALSLSAIKDLDRRLTEQNEIIKNRLDALAKGQEMPTKPMDIEMSDLPKNDSVQTTVISENTTVSTPGSVDNKKISELEDRVQILESNVIFLFMGMLVFMVMNGVLLFVIFRKKA